MTRNSSAAILGIFSAIAISLISPAQAQTPATAADTKQSTSQLTLSMLSHLKKAYSSASKATDKASAQKAAASITLELKQLDTLSPLLAKSSKPTEAEMAIVAEAIAKMELEMRTQIETLTRNLKNREVRTVIDPAMSQFAAKSGATKATMDKLYPANKMLPLVKAAKARMQIGKK